MKSDMDLHRKILLEIEKAPYEKDEGMFDFAVEGYDRDSVSYHIMILDEARLIQARNLNRGITGFWVPIRLTWEGHEFLDAARDNNRWNKAKGAMTQVGGFALDVMKQLLIQYLKQDLHLI
jgi:uncharacterized protein DUF2513